MAKSNKTRNIVAAVAILLIILLTGGVITWVLLAPKDGGGDVDHIIQDGTLSLSLKRNNLNTNVLGEDGVLKESSDSSVTDFTNATGNNIFGLKGDTYIVPDSSFEATMTVTNEGDNAVPFAYWLAIEVTNENTTALASQLKVTITVDGESAAPFYLSEGYTFGSDNLPAASVAVGGTSSFTIKIEYDRLVATNESQGEIVYFDLIVHAFQTV